ncbi:MAG: PAS domain S-box protein [Acidimicrobiales bacterium]|nr:PAS domain S-box protein [Acidimicrobiales bacterium]
MNDESSGQRGPGPTGIPGGALPDVWGSYADLRALYDQLPVPLVLNDLVNRRVYANPEFFHLLGHDGPVDFDAVQVVHPDDLDEIRRGLRALTTQEIERFHGRHRFLRADGTTLIGEVDSRLLRDRSGAPWAVVSTLRDVTPEVEARRAVDASEARFRSLVEHAFDAVAVLDEEARLIYASPAAERLIGYRLDERIGMDALEFVHPDDRDAAALVLANNRVTGGKGRPVRLRLVARDGTVRFVEAVATNLLDDPAVEGVVVNIRDLTDDPDARTALEISETRFRRMLENISDTVTLVTADGSVVATTGNVKEILGYPTEFWSVRNAFDIAHPDDVDRIRQYLVELLEHPEHELMTELRVRHAKGHWETIEATAVNLLDDPNVRAIVLTTRNITQRKQTELELAEARDQAVRALEQRTEFIASVSHEIRTPIHGILGLSELLLTSDIDDEARSIARSISRAAESLKMVLDDILDYSKIEAGRLELAEQRVALADVVDDLRVLFGPQATAKGIDLRFVHEPDLPAYVLTDGLRLRQVLTNLIGNAVKFTAQGEVVVCVGRVPGRNELLRFEVRDTGIGMAPEVLERIFEPFSQATLSTAREYGGTGLGLTIARRLVEMMGGTLTVASEVGVGSTFSFDLPLVLGQPDVGVPARSGDLPSKARAGQPRILVVDDNPVNQLLVSRQLERLGYLPVVAESGEYALDNLTSASERFGAVLMDWLMPGLDGLETTRRIRRWEEEHNAPRTPIIAMTASAMPGDRTRCLEAGMDDFLVKPVSLAALGKVLAEWVPTARTVVAPSNPVGVDSEVIDGLVDELGDPMLVANVVRRFVLELDDRVRELRRSFEDRDFSLLARTAHTLKSTAATLGLAMLSGLCAELERESAGAPFEVAPELISRIEAMAEPVRLALADELARLGSGVSV